MSLSVQLGVVLSLATALASVIGFLYKHKGAQRAPEVDWRRPLRSTLVLFRSGWYTLGIVVALGGWFFHVGALALAPISLVQSVIAGGLVFLTVAADQLFGHRVTRREWIGVALTAAGLAFLAATMAGGARDRHADYATATLLGYVGLLAGAGIAAAAIAELGRPRRPGRPPRAGDPAAARRPARPGRPSRAGDPATARRPRRPGRPPRAGDPAAGRRPAKARRATGLALSAGLLWASSDVTIKAVSGHLDDDGLLLTVVHPLSLIILVASLAGLLVSAKSLQLGDAVPVIAVTSAAANVCTIAAGPLVFGEPMPGDPLGVAVRLLAFALVIVAAALTPPPLAAQAALDGAPPPGAPAAPAATRPPAPV